MAYIITDTCTKDELCVEACPTDCIHPKKDEEGFEAAPQLYVDPEGCIDCGACVPVCPTNSVFIVDEVPADKQEFIAKNGLVHFPGEREKAFGQQNCWPQPTKGNGSRDTGGQEHSDARGNAGQLRVNAARTIRPAASSHKTISPAGGSRGVAPAGTAAEWAAAITALVSGAAPLMT